MNSIKQTPLNENVTLHDFEKSLNIGKQGESIILNFLLTLEDIKSIRQVQDIGFYQRKDIDFIVTFKNGKKYTVEIKTDTYKSPNLYYETISSVENNTLGCFEKTEADYLFYYFIELDILYIFKTKQFRKWAQKEILNHNQNPNKSKLNKKEVFNKARNLNKNYFTSVGYTIPRYYMEQQLAETNIFKKYTRLSQIIENYDMKKII